MWKTADSSRGGHTSLRRDRSSGSEEGDPCTLWLVGDQVLGLGLCIARALRAPALFQNMMFALCYNTRWVGSRSRLCCGSTVRILHYHLPGPAAAKGNLHAAFREQVACILVRQRSTLVGLRFPDRRDARALAPRAGRCRVRLLVPGTAA